MQRSTSEVQCIAAVQQPVQYSSCLQYCLPTVLGTLYRPVYIKLNNFSPNSRLQYWELGKLSSTQQHNESSWAGTLSIILCLSHCGEETGALFEDHAVSLLRNELAYCLARAMITNLRASRTVRSHGYALGHPCDVVLYESRTHLVNE